MAEKLEISVELTALVQSFVHEVTSSKTGAKKKLVSIPVDALYVDRSGRVWANLTAYPCSKGESSHFLKQRVSKAVYASLPDDASGRKNLPFAGNVKGAQAQAPVQASTAFAGHVSDDGEGFPF